jgi:hypothetical protein
MTLNETLPKPIVTADVARVQKRRHALMRARQAAIVRRDFAAMNEITKRLVKLPVPRVQNGVVVLDYSF